MADIQIIMEVLGQEKIEKATRSTVAFENRLKFLNKALETGRITQAQFATGLKEMRRQLDSNGKSWQFNKAQIDRYVRQLQEASEANRAMAAAAQASQKAVHRKGVAVQQVGYQVGDFLVQVQSGTNAFVAFGQQATQLVGVLGMLNPSLIGLSAGLGIAIPLVTAVAAAFSRTSKDADEATKAIEKLKTQIAESKQALEGFRQGIFDKQEKELVDQVAEARLKAATALQAYYDADAEGQQAAWEASQAATTALEGQISLLKEYVKMRETEALREKAAKNIQEQRRSADKALADEQVAMQARLEEVERKRLERKAEIEQEMLQNSVDVMVDSINTYMDAHEAGLAELITQQNELNDAAAELGERLGISFATALSIIRQAKAEAMVGLDAFGGGGDYRYDLPQTIKPEKPKKARSGGGGGKSPAQQLEEYLKAAEKEVALKRKQVGLTESQARAIELETKFLEAKVPLDKARIDALVAEEEALRKATEAEDRRKNMIQTFEGIMESALMSMVDGSQSVEDAFKGMLRSILLEIYRQQVAKPLASGIMQILGFSAKGDVISNGSYVKAFANGGVVTGPTAFPMQGGVGVMGEAGPEAIMPLKRGANGKLGVEMHGGGGDTINVVQNFSFSANGDESVKKIIAQAAPQIAQMTQQKIMDSRRRGGQMKSVFS